MRTIIRVIGLLILTNTLHAQDGYELVWSDEFDYNGLPDKNKWSYDIGNGCPNVCGWGNNELEYYTDSRLENARVGDGYLTISAIKEKFESNDYTSARLVTKGKGDWLYGKIEVRAKLPSGKGTWPAIWMLSTDWSYGGWPESGEIDIMEHVGYEPDKIYGTVHTKAYNHSIGTQKGGEVTIPDCEDEFHIYSIEWTYRQIDFFVDDQKFFTFVKQEGADKWPFDKRFHLLLNLAVGGDWGGTQGIDESIFPQEMNVDYVRVYQRINKSDEDKSTGQMLLSPNPTKDGNFTINLPQSTHQGIRIFNLSGQQIPFSKSMRPNGIEIQLLNSFEQLLLVSIKDSYGSRYTDKIRVL